MVTQHQAKALETTMRYGDLLARNLALLLDEVQQRLSLDDEGSVDCAFAGCVPSAKADVRLSMPLGEDGRKGGLRRRLVAFT
jgi:hypothetical protein